MSATNQSELEAQESIAEKFEQTRRALAFTGWTCFGVALFVVVMLAIQAGVSGSGAKGIGAVISGLAVPAAAFAVGIMLGLLFAIPMMGALDGTRESTAGAATENVRSKPRGMMHNDSLERISHWLATIIVGASLVQLDDLLARLDESGRAVSIAVLGCGAGCSMASPDIAVLGTALIVAFAVGGFLVGYLWTRVVFFHELDMLDKWRVSAEARAVAARASAEGNVQTSPDVLAARPERAQADVRAAVEAIAAVSSKIPTDANDPWRGQFGGSAVAGGYRLSAEVKRSNVPNFFSIKLLVSRVGEATAREAEFFLHPTFPNPRVERKMNKFGNATLSLLAWGAFTVGVRLDNGVELELDLSEVQDAPEVFRNR